MKFKKAMAFFTSMALTISMLAIDCSAVSDSKDIDNSDVNLSIYTYTSISPTTAEANGYMRQRKSRDTSTYSVSSFLFHRGDGHYIVKSDYTTPVKVDYNEYIYSYGCSAPKDYDSSNYGSKLQLLRDSSYYDSVGPTYK